MSHLVADFLARSSHLPERFCQTFALVHGLDAECTDLDREFHNSMPDKAQRMSPKALEAMQRLAQKWTKKSEQKVDILGKAYSSLDAHIRVLDQDLERIASELTKRGVSTSGLISELCENGNESNSSAQKDPSVSPVPASDARDAGGQASAGARKRRRPGEGSGAGGGGGDTKGPRPARGGGGGGSAGRLSEAAPAPAPDARGGAGAGAGGRLLLGGMPVAAAEPTYCVCRDVAYGDMVACDNPECAAEWFHFGCVGLSKRPGAGAAWLCPGCRRAARGQGGGGAAGGGGGGRSWGKKTKRGGRKSSIALERQPTTPIQEEEKLSSAASSPATPSSQEAEMTML